MSYEHLINAARHGAEYPSLVSDIGTEANGLLIKSIFGSAAGKYIQQFENIFEGYDMIKNVILKETKRDCNHATFDRMRNKFFELLMKEKEVWVKIINDSKLTCL